jgi:vacuolar iron transporter family protein
VFPRLSRRRHLPIASQHTPEAIRARLQDGPDQSYIRDFIYGAIDGAVTTFAVAAGAIGADLSGGVVVVLGVANLFADGISMAVSNYLGTRADRDVVAELRRSEAEQIDLIPEGEREEIRQLYAAKGFEGADLERVVEVITADRNRWVDAMIQEEHGLQLEGPRPLSAATATFIAFLAVGSLPLIPFFVDQVSSGSVNNPFLWSAVLTAAAFLAVGAAKGLTLGLKVTRSAAETFAVGGLAASAAWIVGYVLRGVANGT